MRLMHIAAWFCVAAAVGCGKIPAISENRKNFAPWEKCPEQGGIRYVEKYVHDPGHDPTYLALISYEDDADVNTVLKAFGLTVASADKPPTSYAALLQPPPPWFPLKDARTLYSYPSAQEGYAANLWVNPDKKVMLLERTWY